jgi:hypothetical protein
LGIARDRRTRVICTKALPTPASLVALDPAEIFRYNVTPG